MNEDRAVQEPPFAMGDGATVAVESFAEALCFRDRHRHTATEPACAKSRREADALLVLLDIGRSYGTTRGENVGRWLTRHEREAAAPGAAAPAIDARRLAVLMAEEGFAAPAANRDEQWDAPYAEAARIVARLLTPQSGSRATQLPETPNDSPTRLSAAPDGAETAGDGT